MKRTLFIIVCCFLCNNLKAINPPVKVLTFYNGLKQLEAASSFDVANSIQQQMAACFIASENSGINLKVDGFEEMTSNFYTMKLYSMLYSERTLKVVSDIVKTEVIEQPDQNKSMQRKGAQHYVTYVTKKYTVNGMPKTYNDVVFTLINGGYITEMTNAEASGSITTTVQQLSVDQLRTRAAYYYSKGMYMDAYDYYEQLVTRFPTDGDACYRIALLTFWRKGCKHKFKGKREAEQKAKEYIEKAIRYGNSEISNKASNVRANWENNNVYF